MPDLVNVLAIRDLPLPQKLAAGYARGTIRDQVVSLFHLDYRLSQIVSGRSEELLAQMKLAWWREQLRTRPENRPSGDQVLDAITRQWSGQEEALIALVDGWEHLLAASPLPEWSATGFANGRSKGWGELARSIGADALSAERAARRWALMDLASHLSDQDEASMVLSLAQGEGTQSVRLPRLMRSLSVLDGLARRALLKGEKHLLESRTAFLVTMRLGLIGR
ncbi:MAG: hypothetical protein ACK5NN_03615 [Sphingomonadaceae bacterium]